MKILNLHWRLILKNDGGIKSSPVFHHVEYYKTPKLIKKLQYELDENPSLGV